MPDKEKPDILGKLGSGLSIGSDILGAAEGVFDYFSERKKEKKAEQELSRLKTPFYKIQNEFFQNRNIAAQGAEGGLTGAAKNLFTTEAQRGLSGSIGAIQQAGGSPGDIAKLYDTYTGSINKEAATDADAQLKNIQYFMDVNKDLAGQKTEQWTINEYQPYQNKLKELTERRGAAQLNEHSAIQQSIGSLSALGTSLSNQSLLNKLFGNKEKSKISDPHENTFSQNQLYDLLHGGGGTGTNNTAQTAGGTPLGMWSLE